jgi:hypothetical protein
VGTGAAATGAIRLSNRCDVAEVVAFLAGPAAVSGTGHGTRRPGLAWPMETVRAY